MRSLTRLRPDVVVPQMFCLPGMTTYRALLELLGLPYVGSPPDVMALAAHKARAKAVVAAAGVRVPAGEVLARGDTPSLAPPVVVKPEDGDNSLGTTLVRDRAGYAAALDAAFAHSDRALVESYVELGREVRCGAVVRDGELVCLPLEEYRVDRVTKPIRDHADKISRDGDGELKLVAKDHTRAWIVDPRRPGHGAGLGRRPPVPRGPRQPALQPVRLPDRSGRATLVPGGRPVLLVRHPERDPDHGRGGRPAVARPVRGRDPGGPGRRSAGCAHAPQNWVLSSLISLTRCWSSA